MQKIDPARIAFDFVDACRRTWEYTPEWPYQSELDWREKAMRFKFWLKTYGKVLGMAADWGPVQLIKALRDYPWIFDLTKANGFYNRCIFDRRGNYREATSAVIDSTVGFAIEMLTNTIMEPDRVIIHEDMVPPEIFYAMGLHPWDAELMGIICPIMDGHAMTRYIDAAENEGVPPNTCTLPKITLGMFFKGHQPRGRAIVASNLPCDGGATSYDIAAQLTGLPIYRLEVPHYFKNERSEDLFVKDIKRMIAFLEEHTPGRMDWDRLKEICEERNRQVELELELWEMNRSRPSPMPGDCATLSHMFHMNAMPGKKGTTSMWEKVLRLARQNYAAGVGGATNERYRAMMWNPAPAMYSDYLTWCEYEYGITFIIDSMTYNTQPLIDTSSPDSMLLGLGHNTMNGPMARHTRGPMENYFGDMFKAYEYFDLDMIVMAGHIGCKNTAALNQIMREECRRRNIPLCIFEYDLMDPRVVSQEGIRSQMRHFMDNIMKAERLH